MGFPPLHNLDGTEVIFGPDLGATGTIDICAILNATGPTGEANRCDFIVGNIILSIAQQEMGIAHVISAVGENMQALAGGTCVLPTGTDLSTINSGITDMLCAMGELEGALAVKLDTILQMACYDPFDFSDVDCDS